MSKKALYDYQIEEYKQGLIDDAIRQIGYVLCLINDSHEDKSFIKCKVEEIGDFIKHYKLVDDDVQDKYRILLESFSKMD